MDPKWLFILGTSILAKQNYIFVHRNFNSQQGVWVVASNFYSLHHFHHVRRCRIRFCLKTTTSRTSSQFIWVAIITHTAAVRLVSPSNSHEWVCKQVSKFSHRASKPELAVLVYEGKFGKNGFDNHIIRSG